MSKNSRKITISLSVWTTLAILFIIPAVALWGISFDTKIYDNFDNPIGYRLSYLFFAVLMTIPFVMFWIKMIQFVLVSRMNDILSADEDGFVPVAELAKSMGMPEAKMIKKTNNAIRKGYLINCNYSMSQKALLLSDKIGAPQTQRPGMPENRPFVGVSCPCCAASLKIRANTQGTCPFCGRLIIGPPVKN